MGDRRREVGPEEGESALISSSKHLASNAFIQDGQQFMDITATQDTFQAVVRTRSESMMYPSKTMFNGTVKALAKDLSKKNMRNHLETFTAFHTRYYKSSYGVESATWLYEQVEDTIKKSGADKAGAKVQKFDHEWGQFSIVRSILPSFGAFKRRLCGSALTRVLRLPPFLGGETTLS